MTLAGAAFAYVTAEMLPVGLLSEISTDLDVTEGRVGLLLTFYAYGVAALTLPLIGAVKTWPRRRVVVLTVATLAVSQLVAACAVNYPMLVIGRLLCAATHGVFWAVVAPVAATLVPRGQQGKAIAMVYAGTSLAFVLGGPLSSAIGQSWGWRTASAAIGVVAVIIAFSLHRALPEMPVDQRHRNKRDKPKPTPEMRRALAVICAATLFAALGQFASYTFFTLLVEESLGSSGGIRTAMLLVYGAAGAVGVWVAASTTTADRASSRSSRSRRWRRAGHFLAPGAVDGSVRRRRHDLVGRGVHHRSDLSPVLGSARRPDRDRPRVRHLRRRVPDRDCNGRSARCGRRRQWWALTSGGHRGRLDDRFLGDSRVRATRVSPGTGTVYSLPTDAPAGLAS
ncbi:hypothetical protein GCM10020255_079500 [Rhodococcus baikonurensis]